MIPKVQIDVNICLDLLLGRKPFVEYSGKVFELGELGEVDLYLAGLSVDALFYVIRPKLGVKNATQILKTLLEKIKITPVDDHVVRDTLQAGWNDLEDALQYFAAVYGGCQYIITRNPKDYKVKNDQIKVVTPKEFLKIL